MNNVNIHRTFSGSRQPEDRFHDAVENVSSQKPPVTQNTQGGAKNVLHQKLQILRAHLLLPNFEESVKILSFVTNVCQSSDE